MFVLVEDTEDSSNPDSDDGSRVLLLASTGPVPGNPLPVGSISSAVVGSLVHVGHTVVVGVSTSVLGCSPGRGVGVVGSGGLVDTVNESSLSLDVGTAGASGIEGLEDSVDSDSTPNDELGSSVVGVVGSTTTA